MKEKLVPLLKSVAKHVLVGMAKVMVLLSTGLAKLASTALAGATKVK